MRVFLARLGETLRGTRWFAPPPLCPKACQPRFKPWRRRSSGDLSATVWVQQGDGCFFGSSERRVFSQVQQHVHRVILHLSCTFLDHLQRC